MLGHTLAFSGDGQVRVRLVADDATKAPLAIEIENTASQCDPTHQLEHCMPYGRGRPPATVRPTDSGTGLGLALTRALCDMIGCRLELVSLGLGSGSACRITPPTMSRNATLAGTYPIAAEFARTGNMTDGEKVIPLGSHRRCPVSAGARPHHHV